MRRSDQAVQRLEVALTPERLVSIALCRQPRRTLAIHVHRDTTIEVRAPMACPLTVVLDFVHGRRRWINRQLDRVAAYPPAPALQYTHGERHRYLGEWLVLVLRAGSPQQGQLAGECLQLTLRRPTDSARVQQLLEQWYRARAREVFAARLACWSSHPVYSGLQPPPLRLRRMRRRWGSCSVQGIITLNTRLVEQRLELIDYVVVHELCHLRVFNHSTQFYALMDVVLPDWRCRRRALAVS